MAATPSTMIAMVAEDAHLVVAERPVPAPTGREVLVKIAFSALNRADTLQRKGAVPPPPGVTDILGLEMAGEIVAVGPDVQGYAVGQSVMALLSGGGYAQYTAVDERLLMPLPAGFTIDQGAAVPETWLTAFQLLTLVGKVQPGDTVLIHAAGSGVGIAATQLALGLGAKVVAVAGADSKLENATKLGAFATVNYKTVPEFSTAVLEATDGKGVNLILDPVGGGTHMTQNCACAATEARWVLYGLMGGVEPSAQLLGSILRKRLTISGTTLRARTIEYKAELVAKFAAHAMEKFEAGDYKVHIDRVFTLEEADAAHDCMLTNTTTGKVLLSVAHPQ